MSMEPAGYGFILTLNNKLHLVACATRFDSDTLAYHSITDPRIRKYVYFESDAPPEAKKKAQYHPSVEGFINVLKQMDGTYL